MGKKELLSSENEKNKIMLALSDVYFSVHYVNLLTGQFEEIKSIAFVHELIYDSKDILDAIRKYLPKGIDKEYVKEVAEFIDYTTVSERIGDKQSISMNFRSMLENYEFCCGKWIAVRRDENGQVTHALCTLENISSAICEERRRLEEVYEAVNRQSSIVSTLSQEYIDVALLNLSENTIQLIKMGEVLSGWSDYKRNTKYELDLLRNQFLSNIHVDDVAMMENVLDIQNIRRQVEENGQYDGIYRIVVEEEIHYCQYKFLPVEGTDEIIAGFRSVDEVIKKELEHKKTLQEDIQRIKGIASEFTVIHFLNLETDEYVSYFNVDNLRDENLVMGEIMTDYYDAYRRSLDEVCHPDNYAEMLRYADKEEIKNALRYRKKFVRRFRYLNQQGKYCWKNCVMIKFDEIEAEATRIAVAYADAEEEVAAEREHDRVLKEAARKAKAADQAKTNFLFNMSHDIRTPMNAIMGYTGLLEKNLDNPDKQKDYIEKIKVSSEFLLSLINNVLEMAEIESGNAVLDESVNDMGDYASMLDTVFGSAIKEKRIHLETKMEVEHRYVFADPTKIREIVLNLISNAIKYTPDGGSVYTEVEELPCEREGYALIKTTISDTGIGMSEKFLPHIFDEFARERSTTESKNLGTGLGMSIVKSLVELMGGTIEVESELGKGTTFTLLIPHRIAGPDEIEKKNKKVRRYERHLFSGKRILLAEDNDMNAEIAIAFLKEVGFTVERAKDGIECLDMLQQANCGYYNLILMDIQMPNMNGYKASVEIRNSFDPVKSRIPIIAMTANAFEEDRKNAVNAGMNAHVSKPFKPAELVETIAEVLRIKDGLEINS